MVENAELYCSDKKTQQKTPQKTPQLENAVHIFSVECETVHRLQYAFQKCVLIHKIKVAQVSFPHCSFQNLA